MSVNNTVAVFDAIFGKKNEFLRTPKYGIITKDDGWKNKAYNLPFTQTTLLEIFFGVYGIIGIMVAIYSNNPVFCPDNRSADCWIFLYCVYEPLAYAISKK